MSKAAQVKECAPTVATWQLQIMRTRLTLPNHCSCAGVHRVLGTRTLEGLLIELDVHIEYRIVPEEARQVSCVTCTLSYSPPDGGQLTHSLSLPLLLPLQLYEQFGEWYYVTSNLTLISRSVLRNTASRYGGLEYMTGDRAQIAAGMQADLNVAFAQFHATISEVCAAIGSNCSSRPLLLRHLYTWRLRCVLLSFVCQVNIRHITLTPAFEAAFAAVRAIKLDASKALETREVRYCDDRSALC